MSEINNIVLNIPHSSTKMIYTGWDISDSEKKNQLDLYINRWTDWFTDRLFWMDEPRIRTVIGKFNRFTVDYERLLHNPMEGIGQGILYTRFEKAERYLSDDLRTTLMENYHEHIQKLTDNIDENSILIDCHSFPNDLSDDIDVCLGFNDDWSKPDEKIIRDVTHLFAEAGYRVGLNNPYSNSISPETGFPYPTLMIELNKRIYMKDTVTGDEEKIVRIQSIIKEMYGYLLLEP